MPVVDSGPRDGYDDNTEWLIDTLPAFMEGSTNSGNWKLFEPVGRQFDNLDEDIKAVDRASSIQLADTIDQLDKHGTMVGTSYSRGEKKEHYRSRLIAEFQLNTANGSLIEFINSVATIVNSDPREITYIDYREEFGEAGVLGVSIPGNRIDATQISEEELANLVTQIVPAGRTVETQYLGTLNYVSAEEYEALNWDDYDDGYIGLDTYTVVFEDTVEVFEDEVEVFEAHTIGGTGGSYSGMLS